MESIETIGGGSAGIEPSAAMVPTAVQMDPRQLDEKRLAEARAIAAKIDAKDAQCVIAFGTKPQSELATATETIIGSTRARAAGEAGETLSELLRTLKAADMDSLSGAIDRFLAKLPLVGGWFSATKQLIEAYEPIAGKITKIEARLHQQQLTLLTDYENLDRMFDDNLRFLQLLEVYIAAAHLKTDELKAELGQLEAAADKADPLKSQEIQDTARAIERLHQRLYDLEITRMVAIQTGPQIRLIQDGNEKLATKIHTAVLTTIPLWKGQIAMAINLANQKEALDNLTAVTDATNEMLVNNSKLLKSSTLEIRRQTERGVIDIETLQETTHNLITTVEEALAVSEEGRIKRAESQKALQELEQQLRGSLAPGRKGPIAGF